MAMDWSNPLRRAFYYQRNCAKRRGISFELTFKQWFGIWKRSRHLHERGNRGDQYCMARFGDRGPYAVDNVQIIKGAENISQCHKGRQFSARHLANLKKAAERRLARGEYNPARRGYRHSAETRAKISAANKGKVCRPAGTYRHSEETKEKIRLGHARRPKRVMSVGEVETCHARKLEHTRRWRDRNRAHIAAYNKWYRSAHGG